MLNKIEIFLKIFNEKIGFSINVYGSENLLELNLEENQKIIPNDIFNYNIKNSSEYRILFYINNFKIFYDNYNIKD